MPTEYGIATLVFLVVFMFVFCMSTPKKGGPYDSQ